MPVLNILHYELKKYTIGPVKWGVVCHKTTLLSFMKSMITTFLFVSSFKKDFINLIEIAWSN